MGDGPEYSSKETHPRHKGETPWTGEESVPRNPLFQSVPGVEYKIQELLESEKVTPPPPIRNLFDPETLHEPFPTAKEVRAESGRFWNTNVDIAQVAWNAYHLHPQGPWPQLPPMFPVFKGFTLSVQGFKTVGQNLYANLLNFTSKKYRSPWEQKLGPSAIAAGAIAAEFVLDEATRLDKNEYQTFRILADYFGPAIVLSKSPMLGSWWQKGLCLVGTHTAGRLIDKWTEEPVRKLTRSSDQ